MKLSRKECQTRDLALIAKIRAGDTGALETLIDRYLLPLIGFFRYLRVPDSIIEDLAQETFEKVIKKLEYYDESKMFSSWLMTIGRNHYFDKYRKEARMREQQLDIKYEPTPSPEEQIVVRQSASELLKTLKPDEKFLIDMRIFKGMTFAEISEVVGEKEVTLRSRIFRILGKLRIEAEKNSFNID